MTWIGCGDRREGAYEMLSVPGRWARNSGPWDNVGMDSAHAERMHRAIRSTLVVLMTQVDELFDLYAADGCRGTGSPHHPPDDSSRISLQRGTYTVHYKGKVCFLGCSVGFRVLERLAQRPNEYIQTDRLIDELWSGARAYSTVRSTVCRLKATLRRGGLEDLADRIDGRMPGHYGLMLQDP